MDLKEIQALIKFVSTSGVDEVCIEEKDFKISIKKKSHKMVEKMAAPALPPAPAVSVESSPPPPPPPRSDNSVEIKSPMIGTFYRSSGPDKSVFVNVGDEIEKGQVLCIIEAMKLFNEIESEVSGRILKILAEDATPVEYDQPLFLIEPF